MATLPSSTVVLDESGAGVAVTGDLICIMSCSELGTANQVRTFTKVQDDLDTFGRCDGVEFAAHLVEVAKCPYMRVKLATATAGAIGPVDTRGVTGTSVITFTGTPLDEEDIVLDVVTGGTIGTAGIVIKVSRDGGKTYGGLIRLGTANTYAIPGTGITANFAAGTLVANDRALCKAFGPKFDGAGLTAAFAALAAYPRKPRVILLCGEADDGTDVDSIITEVEAFETTHGRHTVVIHSLRDKHPDVVTKGVADVDFDGTADTITRGTGSFVTDGWKVGMVVTISGTTLNNGTGHVVTNVAASVLTVSSTPGLVTEANQAAVVLVGSEPKATWRAAIEAIVSATPSTSKVSEKVMVTGGRARRRSPINAARKRRPAAWPIAIAEMAHDIHVSPAKVENGALAGWSIHSDDGTLEEHDERIDGGLLGARIAGLRTFNEKPGVFCSLPVTLDEDGKPLSRLPVVLVGQLACTVAQRSLVEKLSGEYVISPTTGRLLETEVRRIEAYVQTQINIALLTRGPEGQRASSAVFTLARDTDLRVPGAIVTYEIALTALGYIENFSGRVRVGG